MLSKIWSCSATSRQKAYDPAHEARPRHVDDSVAAARGWVLCDAAVAFERSPVQNPLDDTGKKSGPVTVRFLLARASAVKRGKEGYDA